MIRSIPENLLLLHFRVHIGPKIEMRVIALGLDDSGKTSILFKLKQNEFVPTIPTIGFNVEASIIYSSIVVLMVNSLTELKAK